jgi:glycosyltransferase involved in cell wall biosynthesis
MPPTPHHANKELTIPAEYILPHCGLANYLETLVSALRPMPLESGIVVRSIVPLWDDCAGGVQQYTEVPARHLMGAGVRDFILKHIQPRLPKFVWNGILGSLSLINYYGLHRSIAAWWKKQNPETCVLLPHIPLDPAVKPYYRALMRCRLIWVIHDLHPFFIPEAWNDHALKMCGTVLPELARKARHIIVHNNFTKESAVKYLGADPAKMTVIRLPHIMNLTSSGDSASDAAVLASLGVRKPYALWASSTTILHKNHERLIKAWVRVQQWADLPIQLVCSGNKQPRWNELAPLLETVRNDAEILFTDTVSKSTLQVLLRNAKLAVCPTLFEGGGCGPAMEAAHAGIPVVCSDIPQIKEQYDQREDLCRFFDPRSEASIAEAVLVALRNETESRAIAERAKNWVQKNRTWDDVAREYWQVIRRVQGGTELSSSAR